MTPYVAVAEVSTPATRQNPTSARQELSHPHPTPREIVEASTIYDLADVVAGDSFLDFGDGRFRCPLCQFADHNGGTATIHDDWTWSCRRCVEPPRYKGARPTVVTRTRYELERIVLERADYLGALLHLADVNAA